MKAKLPLLIFLLLLALFAWYSLAPKAESDVGTSISVTIKYSDGTEKTVSSSTLSVVDAIKLKLTGLAVVDAATGKPISSISFNVNTKVKIAPVSGVTVTSKKLDLAGTWSYSWQYGTSSWTAIKSNQAFSVTGKDYAGATDGQTEWTAYTLTFAGSDLDNWARTAQGGNPIPAGSYLLLRVDIPYDKVKLTVTFSDGSTKVTYANNSPYAEVRLQFVDNYVSPISVGIGTMLV